MSKKMKTNVSKAKFLIAAVVLSLGSSAFLGAFSSSASAQQSVDPRTRDLLIEKLTQVYLNLAPSDSAKVAITLRLADLHSERARLDAMKDLESGCTVCTAGKADRKKALSYYQEVLPNVPQSSIGKVLAQVGHLYEMTGNDKDAVTTYEKILKDPKAPQEAQAEANLSLAEVYFKRKDFPKARAFYSAVLTNPTGGSRGLAAYRLAWCDFNDGKNDLAISGLKKILTTPELASKSGGSNLAQVDRQFLEEVSRDLATFMARKSVTIDDAKSLYTLSPESAKLANVSYLAAELERLGQPQGSIALWRFVQDKQSKPQARLEGHVRLAQLEMEQKQLEAASKDFDSALSLWTQMGACNDQDCAELHARMRKFVTDWNRTEKKQPSEALLAAYQSYTKTFPQEADMQLWAGKVAQDQKQYAMAVQFDLKAANLASSAPSDSANASQAAAERPAPVGKAPKSAKAAASALPSSNDIIEAGLLQAIESAELSKDKALLATAYDSYLSLSKEKKKTLEVAYQKAHLIYDAGQYDQAAEALRTVALSAAPKGANGADEAGAADIKTQAAQLSLDSLVLLKDDARLEAWSKDYARAFPKDAEEFQGISRKSVLTQATAEATKGDATSLKAAWETLSRFDLSTAKAADKATYYKNRLVLAEKLGHFSEARDAVDNLLRLQGLSAADQQYALSRKAWLAEIVLDFDTALTTTQKLSNDGLSGADGKAQKALKLAMYAELAKKDPKPFYAQFLKESKDEDKNVAITAQLVRDSKDPLKELEKSKAVLMKRPEQLGDLYLEAFARSGSIDIAKRATAIAAVAASSAGKVLAREIILDEYAKFQKKIAAQTIDSSSQKKMAATLKARVALLEDAEKLVSKAVESGDWTAQLVTLDLLGKQSERFYQEVLALPVPQGLSPEEESQYLQLLSQQAAPHQLRANDVAKKVSEFWDNKDALAQLDKAATSETGARRTVMMKDIQVLASVAPESKKPDFASMLAKSEPVKEVPTLASMEGARQAVRENPMSRPSLEALLSLEKKSSHSDTMVAYLEGRLQTLDSGVAPDQMGGALAPSSKAKGAK
jgi:hypothetical protein